MVYEAMQDCECNGMGEVIDWVVFEALWAFSSGGQAQRVGLNRDGGDDDDARHLRTGCKSSDLSL